MLTHNVAVQKLKAIELIPRCPSGLKIVSKLTQISLHRLRSGLIFLQLGLISLILLHLHVIELRFALGLNTLVLELLALLIAGKGHLERILNGDAVIKRLHFQAPVLSSQPSGSPADA